MSCSDDTVDCAEALDRVYEYLDGELDPSRLELVRLHLDECSHCLQQFGLEQEVRMLVARGCTCAQAPQQLRDRILARITTIRVSAVYGGGVAFGGAGFGSPGIRDIDA